MRGSEKTISILCLIILGISLSVAGCKNTAEDKLANTLWVVTEQSNSDGMNLQAEIIAERMEEVYPGLTVNLEVLPTEEVERELRLKQLRVEIMSGNGPDVYLLPTGSELISDEPIRGDNITITPLFPDVQQSMRNGIFLDITQYYNSDIDLDSATLKQDVLDAGVINGCRYVLPLRFDIPVIYTRPDICLEYGLAPELFEQDFLTVARTVLEVKNAENAAIGLKFPQELETLGSLLDYTHGKVLILESLVSEYLELWQYRNAISSMYAQEMYDQCDLERRILTMSDGLGCSEERWDSMYDSMSWPKKGKFCHECFNVLSVYCDNLYHWSTCDIPVYTGYLSGIFDTVGVTAITGQTVNVYPLRDCNGNVHAYVTYWGAIGANCNTPPIAYEFLRQFYTEEFQWDLYRPRAERIGAYWEWESEPQHYGLVEKSLPIRTTGCVEPLWDNVRYQVEVTYISWVRETRRNVQTIQRTTVNSEDIPELTWEVDCVSFPLSLDADKMLNYKMSQLNNDDGTPTDADIDQLAENVYQNLWWHLAEG